MVEQDGSPAIYVGMPGKEFNKLIREHSCKEIADSVGIRPRYSPKFLEEHDVRFHWIIIPGDTCLFVRLSRLKGEEDFTIQSIRKGADGAGYGGELKWLGSDVQTVKRVELTKLQKTEQTTEAD